MYIHKYKLQDKNDYPVRNPTCGIYVLQSLQLRWESLEEGRTLKSILSPGLNERSSAVAALPGR